MTSLKLVSPYRPPRRSNFRSSKRNLKIPKKWIFVAVIAMIFVGGGFYLFFLSSTFKVKKINIVGNQQLTIEQLQSTVNQYLSLDAKKLSGRLGFSKNNLLILSTDILESRLYKQYNQIETVRVSKRYSDQVFIEIKERKPIMLYCQFVAIGDNARSVRGCYLVDGKGIAYREAPYIDGSNMPVVEDWSSQEVVLGQAVSNEKTALFILDVTNIFSTLIGVKPAYFLVQSDFDLAVTTQSGWQVYLNLQKDVNSQLHVLRRLIDQEIKDKISTLKYIDLRVDGRIYYK